MHSYSRCPYLIEQRRSSGWALNKEIQGNIDEALARSDKLRQIIEDRRQQAADWQKQNQSAKQAPKAPEETLNTFAIKQKGYKLVNSWILDSGADTHLYNDRTRFKFERMAADDDTLIAGKITYSIEAFGSVEISIQTLNGPRYITLLNVALVPDYFTNIASLDRFISKGVHFDTQNSRLHTTGNTFCTIQRVDKHWVLEYSPPNPTSNAAFAASNEPRKAISASADRWHTLLGHAGKEAVSHLENSVEGAILTEKTYTNACEPCSLNKT
jgi:hypothetical protein